MSGPMDDIFAAKINRLETEIKRINDELIRINRELSLVAGQLKAVYPKGSLGEKAGTLREAPSSSGQFDYLVD